MAKNRLVTYKYNVSAPTSFILYGFIPYLIILLVASVIFYLAVVIHWTALLTFILLIFIFSSFGRKNKAITLDMKFMVIGSDILWYQNIEKIEAYKERRELIIETKDSRKIRIHSTSFPTNARKDFKIRKNQDAKFFKVSQKIIDKVQKVSPDTKISIR